MPNRRGFTLLEAMVSAVLVGVGIVAALGAITAVTGAEATAIERERVTRLAIDKLEELRATGEVAGASLSGDFTDRNENRYSWEATTEPSGIENLDVLRVTVTPQENGAFQPTVVSTLIFVPPTTGTQGATNP